MNVLRRSEQIREDRYPGVPRYGLAGATLGSKKLHVGDLTYEPGSIVPHHVHPDAEETQIMLEGELECWLAGHRFVVRAGDCVVAKRGVGHAFFNRTMTPARMITVFSVSPPTTNHTPDPNLSNEMPSAGVKFGLWPMAGKPTGKLERFEINSPVDATETRCELIRLPTDAKFVLEPGNANEAAVFCLSGTVDVQPIRGEPISAGPGDFLFSQAETLAVRTINGGSATLLAIQGLI